MIVFATLALASAVLAAAAGAGELPETIDPETAVFEVELTCHMATARFRFEGENVLIEDLGDDGKVEDRHEFTDGRLFGIVVADALADSFARDPEVVEGIDVIDDGSGVLQRFEVSATTGCAAVLDLSLPGYRKRSDYRTEEGIPGRIDKLLQKIHFQIASGEKVDPFSD